MRLWSLSSPWRRPPPLARGLGRDGITLVQRVGGHDHGEWETSSTRRESDPWHGSRPGLQYGVRCGAAQCLLGAEKHEDLRYEQSQQHHPRASLWAVTGGVLGALQSPVLGAAVVTMQNMYRESAHPAYPSCPRHNRLCPHPVVGWLTPAYPEQLPTFHVRGDRCKAEEQARVLLCSPPSYLPASPAVLALFSLAGCCLRTTARLSARPSLAG
jgi:hypothetical protein